MCQKKKKKILGEPEQEVFQIHMVLYVFRNGKESLTEEKPQVATAMINPLWYLTASITVSSLNFFLHVTLEIRQIVTVLSSRN